MMERQASFISKHRQMVCRTIGMGKVITKQRKMHKDGAAKIECKTIKERYQRSFI
jgi:hypothetical protein